MPAHATTKRNAVAVRWAAPARLAADTGLLALAAAWGAWSSPYGLWLWTALSLGWMADALAWPRAQRHRARRFLAASLGFVLAARVALVLGLGSLRPTVPVAGAALAVVLAAAALFGRPFVAAFPARLRKVAVALLGALVVLLAAGAGAADATSRWTLLLGALLLVVGDLLMVRQRFVERSWVNDAVGLPLHYVGLLLLLYGL